MNKFGILTVPIALLIFISMNLYFMNYDREAWREFQERKVDIAVNYAVDAATDEIVRNTTNLGTDYADFERLKVEPNVALDMFITVMVRNLGWADSRENRLKFRTDNLPVFVVASYDGFYLSKPTKINSSGAYDQVFSLKQPYMWQNGGGVYYALNLGLNDARTYNGVQINKVSPVPLDKTLQKEIITSNISDSMAKTLYDAKDGNIVTSFYIPSAMTSLSRTNPVSNVSVLAYIDELYIGPGDPIDSFAIGGAHITHEKFVGGYIRAGIKYYSYMTNIPTGVVVLETFENSMFAAEAGYYFDPEYLK